MTDLGLMLATLDTTVRHGEFVFTLIDGSSPLRAVADACVVEDEGVTAIVRREVADAEGLPYDFVAAWITLTVRSSLKAVGLTAVVARALADAGISCNVVAAFHHDHLLVPAEDRLRAVEVLDGLRRDSAPERA